MVNSWLVVANSAEARFFDIDFKKRTCEEIKQFTHSESRLHERELVSDRQGRAHDPAGNAIHAVEQRQSPQEHEAELFARLIAEQLSKALEAKAFKHLHLAAPPAFLGILRKSLDHNVYNALSKVIDKNLIGETPEKIFSHFPTVS